MLVDEVKITIKAGNGGNGAVLFRREKFIPKGGPWGGDGGKGGNIILKTVEDIAILRRYRNKTSWQAENGQNGGKANRRGKNGKDLILLLPTGTTVTDISNNKVYDLKKIEEILIIAIGGRGGLGNCAFASPVNRTPKHAENGQPGEEKKLKFELKLIADVGLIGLPNVGKSSLLNCLTNASVKVADYNFTTLDPNLGVMDGLILADIPGLIEGASNGKGLGFKFLRHISRTKMLLHCISSDSQDPYKDYLVIRKELELFDENLLNKKEIVLFTKTDLVKEKELTKKTLIFSSLSKKVLYSSIFNNKNINLVKQKIIDENEICC
ncbi:GTPase ObgE [Candidatus Gottesmanbacteria bacterium CG23_combo_of_CG06-09_8_20_14_all_37_19]|nr:MAG: GTPase ObgE [Candidatus Gottesmanbacteria bacterium CG23_combo_of_CG06-09_8_20_14_all_37_19]